MNLKQTLAATLAFLVVGASAISCGNSSSTSEDNAKNLSLSPDGKSATANCYIVSEAGAYKFQTVKGNSSESVGNVAKAEVFDVSPNQINRIKPFSFLCFSATDVVRKILT